MAVRTLLFVPSLFGAALVLAACSDVTSPTEPSRLAPRQATAAAASADKTCPAPGTGLAGALNMLLDPTMVTVPMMHDSPKGNEGMFRAVAQSGC